MHENSTRNGGDESTSGIDRSDSWESDGEIRYRETNGGFEAECPACKQVHDGYPDAVRAVVEAEACCEEWEADPDG